MSRVRTQRGARAKDDRRRYEASDLDPRAAGWTIGGLGAIVVVVCLGVAGLFLMFGSVRGPAPVPPVASAAPALQIDERADREAIDARAQARLERGRGRAGLDAAMHRTAAAGWDAPR